MRPAIQARTQGDVCLTTPKLDSQREFRHESQDRSGSRSREQALRDLGWRGLRLRSSDDGSAHRAVSTGMHSSSAAYIPYESWGQLIGRGDAASGGFTEGLRSSSESAAAGASRSINRILSAAWQIPDFEDHLHGAHRRPPDGPRSPVPWLLSTARHWPCNREPLRNHRHSGRYSRPQPPEHDRVGHHLGP